MRTVLALTTLLLLTSLSACDPPNGRLCDERAVSSVTVALSSALGEPVPEASVSFRALVNEALSADIGPGPFQACEQVGDTFVCGFELAGRIQVLVEAGGYEPEERIVDVAQGACHVTPEHLDIELEQVSCTADIAPSVILSLVDGQGERIPGAWAGWGYPDSDSAWQPCDPLGPNLACGWEQSGSLEINAGAEGFLPWYGTVEVDTDECHVITRFVEVTLEEDDVPCTGEVRPSIIVTVIDNLGNAVPYAETWFVPHMKPLEPVRCDSSNNGRFFCGEEEPGEFDVIVNAVGYYSFNLTVAVPADTCHVQTQHVEARLQEWGPIDG
jgi:hypothetical protein